MFTVFRRIEDLMVFLVRIVLPAFMVFALVGMGIWAWDHFKPKKQEASMASVTQAPWIRIGLLDPIGKNNPSP